MADDYAELAGRRIKEEVTRTVYICTGISTDYADTTRPVKGDTLGAGDTVAVHSIKPICQSVDYDEIRYPGRFTWTSIWESPLTRAELFPA